MRIERLHIRNFRQFRDLEIRDIGSFSVFIGANGVGKSTLFDVFGFLSHALRENVNAAIANRGGYHEVLSRGLDPEKDTIEFEVRFRPAGDKAPLVTYQLHIDFYVGKARIKHEMLQYRRGQRGRPWQFLVSSYGKGKAVTNENLTKDPDQLERDDFILDSDDILAIKGLGQFSRFPTIAAFRKLLEGWFVSDLRIEAGKTIGDVSYQQHVNSKGSNLPQVASYLKKFHPDIFDKILEKTAQRVPGIQKVEAVETESGQILLRFKDGSFKDPFNARWVSDGTIKMFGYLLMLYDPEPFPLLCIEEPENYLYHEILEELVEELRAYAVRGGQVLVTTHSPDLADALEIQELYFMTKKAGYSNVVAARDIEIVRQQNAEGYRLGWLWQRGFFPYSGLS
ncbi:MAG: AAA family ATPase [Thalassospira sp.]|jgi:predicted ATPase|nr:AAA family ATPase [Thalassospira sp.]